MGRFRIGCGLVVLILVGGACQSGSNPSTTDAPASARGDIDWFMADRFGIDSNGDGLPDVPNTLEYVLNQPAGFCTPGCDGVVAEFDVTIDGGEVELVSATDSTMSIDSYSWRIVDGSGDVIDETVTDAPVLEIRLPEGEFEVTLDVAGAGAAATISSRISVEDTLLVSIGDSFGGGEGNPERPGDPAVWADSGSPDRTQQDVDHEQAHRSTLAAGAQAALELERRDSNSSVTFVFLAASGASINEGVLGPAEDVADTDTTGFRSGLRPQLEELEEILGCAESGCRRSVDTLTMSLGGNDIEFSFALGTLVALEPQLLLGGYDNLLDRLLSSVGDRLEALPGSFETLANRLGRLGIGEVFLNAYPSGSSVRVDGEFAQCEEAGGDLIPGLEVDSDELNVLDAEIIGPLNDVLQEAAATHDWVLVDDHLASFAGHGYCGSDPYLGAGYLGNPFPVPVRPASDPGARWFRQAGESVEIQGGGGFFEPARLATAGTFHPNESGHFAYAQALLDAMDGS